MSKFKLSHVFTNRHIGVTLLLAFSSGLPLPLVKGTFKAWMASEGVDLKRIGLFSLIGLPYTFKFLWSPFLDLISPPILNRRTGWILIFQILLMFSIAALGFTNPQNEIWVCAALGLMLAFFSASQDIVIDAYRADLLKPEERGPGSGATVTGARLALIVGGAFAIGLADKLPWSRVYLIMSAFMLIGVFATLIAPAPTQAVAKPKSLQEAVVEPFLEFFKRPGALWMLLLVLTYKLGDAVAGEMTTPFLFQIGFSKLDVAAVNKTLGMTMTIVGALFGGGLVTKMGLYRSLWMFAILQMVSNLAFIPLAYFGKQYSFLFFSVGVENFCGGMGTAAFIAYLLSLTDQRFSATQYALLTSVMALTPIGGGVFAGFLAEFLRGF